MIIAVNGKPVTVEDTRTSIPYEALCWLAQLDPTSAPYVAYRVRGDRQQPRLVVAGETIAVVVGLYVHCKPNAP